MKYLIIALPIIVYGTDAMLNFPVARPLMQSSLAIYIGLTLSTYLLGNLGADDQRGGNKFSKLFFSTILLLIIPGTIIHIISYILKAARKAFI